MVATAAVGDDDAAAVAALAARVDVLRQPVHPDALERGIAADGAAIVVGTASAAAVAAAAVVAPQATAAAATPRTDAEVSEEQIVAWIAPPCRACQCPRFSSAPTLVTMCG